MSLPLFSFSSSGSTGLRPSHAQREHRLRRLWTLALVVGQLILGAGVAWTDVPVVYHSPADDGAPPESPVDVPPGATLTVFLYLDGGSEASPEIRCSTGTGDEVCFWNVVLQTSGTATLSSFVPAAGLVHHLDPGGTSLGINGGDPWRGDLGPRRIGELVLDGGSGGGGLELTSGQAVDSSLGVSALAPALVVPEPAVGLSLGAGVLMLGLFGRLRGQRVVASLMQGQRRQLLGRSRGALARCAPAVAFILFLATTLVTSAQAQTSVDCGDVVSNGVIDAADLDALRRFLAGDPTAPDLQGDPQGLARCDVSGDGVCDVGDYARIRRYMIELSGGLDATCPLSGTEFAPVVLAPPVVDQGSTLSTDRSSVLLTGTAEPGELIRVEGVPSVPSAAADVDGTWEVDVPLIVGAVNTLDVQRDFGGGYLSEPAQLSVTQTDAAGTGRIEGVVLEAGTNAPVEAATVSVHSVSATTDAFGRFRLGDLPEGRMILRVSSAGYVPSAIATSTDTVRLPAGGALSSVGLQVSLAPMAATQTIGSAGGTLTTPLGFELEIPAGSLASDTEIALTELVGSGASSLSGLPAVDIGPGPITFDPPAILRLPISGFEPGQPADFVQVDQVAGTATPRVGSTGGSGVIQLEVFSSAGDGIEPVLAAYKYEAVFPQGDGGVPFSPPPIEFDNCRNLGTGTQIVAGSNQSLLFTGDPLGGASPLLRAQYESDPRPLAEKVKGLLRPNSITEQTVLVPPGTRGILRVEAREFTVEQPIYEIRYGGAVNGLKNRLGTLRYRVLVPQSVVIDRVDDCPRPEGSGWGDPHLIRFDHVGQAIPSSSGDGRYDFQGAGEFVLFESTEDGMVVQSRFEQFPARPSVTITTAAAMDVGGDRVMVDIDGAQLRVRLEGTITPLTVGVPVSLAGGGELERVSPLNTQDELVVRWPDSSVMSISLLSFLGSEYLNLYPDLAPQRFGAVQGLLGNANGILNDDLNLRDGTPADPLDLYTTYADSWRISPVESLFDYEVGEDTSTYNGTPPDPDFGLEDLDPADRQAAEDTCIAAGITEDPLLSECALDVALLGGAATGGSLDTLDKVPNEGTYVAVSAQASAFQAGRSAVVDLGGGGGAGLLPSELPLDPGLGRVMRVLDSAGTTSFSSADPGMPPDGMDYGDVEWGTWNGLAGPSTRRMGHTLAVFLDDGLPPSAPAGYDCGEIDGSGVAPEIGQIFCLGDGLSAANEPQTFFVPDGATRLFLGFAERLASQLIETDVHHLGDDFATAGLFALAPDPEGFSWTSDPFAVPTAFTPSSARVIVDLVETNVSQNSIRVNGTFVANLPVIGGNGGVWAEDLAFPVDPAILTATGNTIELRSAGSNLDDYLFKDVRFELVPPFETLPDAGDAAPYHIGDDSGAGSTGLFALMVDPIGTSWESEPFAAPSSELLLDARVLLDIAATDASGNEVLLNGVRLGFLPVRNDATTWSTDIAFPFDPDLLQETGNRITVRAGVGGLPVYDDFMIQNVRVETAPLDAAPPGGYSDNAGIHEFIIDVAP